LSITKPGEPDLSTKKELLRSGQGGRVKTEVDALDSTAEGHAGIYSGIGKLGTSERRSCTGGKWAWQNCST
jgi:hypothetical protein